MIGKAVCIRYATPTQKDAAYKIRKKLGELNIKCQLLQIYKSTSKTTLQIHISKVDYCDPASLPQHIISEELLYDILDSITCHEKIELHTDC